MPIMEYEDFKALEGITLLIQAADGDLKVRLATVDSLGDGVGQHRTPFSLLLEAPMNTLLEQGMYPVVIEQTTMDLFLVPIGPAGELMCYEVVFN
jgi:hypothetical protein